MVYSPQSPLAGQEQRRLLGTPISEYAEFRDSKSTLNGQKSLTKIEGALPDLFYGALLPCVPVVLVSSILLTIIFTHQVRPDPGWEWLRTPGAGEIFNPSPQNLTLAFSATGGDAAYYVRFNPAILVVIASWTSKIIPFVTSSSMAVIGFFAGRRILVASRDQKFGQLPTPHQMSILIKLLNGAGIMPLWETIMYRVQNYEPLVQPIPLAFGALSFVVILTLLIGAADTWFAATTKPVIQQQLTRHLTPIHAFGRGLNPEVCGEEIWGQAPCPSNSQTMCNYPCNIETWSLPTGPDGDIVMKKGIKWAQESAEALLGNSDANIIHNASSSQDSQQNSNAQNYFFLGDVHSGQDLDFLASAVSVTTQCEVVTQNCQLSSSGPGFSCFGYESPSFTYSGEVGVDPVDSIAPDDNTMVGIQFFNDALLQNPIGSGEHPTELFGSQNPMHFLTWSKGFPPVDTSKTTFDEMRRNKFLQIDSSGENVFILNCSTTIYNTMYTWINGQIFQRNQSLAPDTYGAILSAPFATNSALGHLSLENAAALAAYKSNPQDLGKQFANGFSRAAVALSAGVMKPLPNLLEQSRSNTVLLTRIAKLPLYFLISVKALYALTALIFAALAYLTVNIHEAQEVKARLTVDGLVTGLFEPSANQQHAVRKIEEMYDEHGHGHMKNRQVVIGNGGEKGMESNNRKVGMKQTVDGGWIWVISDSVRNAWTTFGIGEAVKVVGGSGGRK